MRIAPGLFKPKTFREKMIVTELHKIFIAAGVENNTGLQKSVIVPILRYFGQTTFSLDRTKVTHLLTNHEYC